VRLARRTLLACTLASCAGWPEPLDELAALGASRKAELAVAYQDLRDGHCLLLGEDLVMHAASTMKVAVMIELFREWDAGRLRLDDEVLVANSFKSIADGSGYELDPADDTDGDLYAKVGQQVTVLELLERMIAKSSNLATNLLIARAEPARIQQAIESLGTTRMLVCRGVEDQKAFDAGRNNVTTARDLMLLMAALARDEAASPAACQQMRALLERQEFRETIPAGLPPGTRIAHKTGWITRIHHDAAIVEPQGSGPYVLVVLTRGIDDAATSAALIAEVAGAVHKEHLRRARLRGDAAAAAPPGVFRP
jgi:beta-lactamase class A